MRKVIVGLVVMLAGSANAQDDAKAAALRIKAETATHPFLGIINAHASAYGVDAALVMAVITVESNGNPNATSHAGAMGLMQLMPATCIDYGVMNPYDPSSNIKGGTALLANHLRRYNGDLEKVLAAYNAGPRRADNGSWRNISETRRYVPKVLEIYEALQPGGDGLSVPDPSQVVPPVYAPPSTIPAIKYLDLMFDTVRKVQVMLEPTGVAQHGTLEDVAAMVLSDYVQGKVKQKYIQERVRKDLAKAGLTFTNLTVDLMETPDATGFVAAWEDRKPAPGTLVGLAHNTRGTQHAWLVIRAKQ